MVVDDHADVIAEGEAALAVIGDEAGDKFLKLGARDVDVHSLGGVDILASKTGIDPFIALAVECFIGNLADFFYFGVLEAIIEIAVAWVEFDGGFAALDVPVLIHRSCAGAFYHGLFMDLR